MKIHLVLGTRPQIIKSAPIIHTFLDSGRFDFQIIHTGQHYDYLMSREFFNELKLPDPFVDLGVGSGSHGWQTAEMLSRLEKVFVESKPDVVIVPGDTNSTLAGSLAAVKLRIPIVHVESGARSYDMSMPEEVNRILTDHCSTYLFTVSSNCSRNLRKEGFNGDRIFMVGDTMLESILLHQKDIDSSRILNELGLKKKAYYLLTLHRQENLYDVDKLKRIISTLSEVKIDVVFPCHPHTKKRLIETGLDQIIPKQFKIVDPVPYYQMLNLIKNARIVLTDSGGIQKETSWLNTPCVTLRENTEWVETVKAGVNILAGSDPKKIRRAIKRFSETKTNSSYEVPSISPSEQILKIIEKNFK